MDNAKLNSTFNQGDDLHQMSVVEVSEIQLEENASLLNQVTPPNFVTQRNRPDNELRNDFKSFQDTIISTLESWFQKQDDRQSKILNEFEEIRKSFNFMCSKYDELAKTTEDMQRRIDILEKKTKMCDSLAERIVELQNGLDIMEQQARQCNVEINNLPEKRGEDLVSAVIEFGALVKQPITKQDIVSVHRVPHASTNIKRPKNVILKLSSRILRDNIVASVRMAKGITTNQLNISGPPQNVYLNEHLTLKNKKLFRETRDAVKNNGFKFSWIKNGAILVRENETSPIFAVRRQEDLLKIKKKSN